MSYLYDSLARYGDVYALNLDLSPSKVMDELKLYESDWVAYNPRKNIPRKGLSITSLDGGLSGIPDLDSVREYNIKHNLDLDETSFNKKTELCAFLVQDALAPFENYLGRTHFIRMERTGCFPPHRDQYSIDVNSFRLFIAIDGCNPPDNYFIIDEKIYNFTPVEKYIL